MRIGSSVFYHLPAYKVCGCGNAGKTARKEDVKDMSDKTTRTPGPASSQDLMEVMGPSPQDSSMVRVKHALARVEVNSPPEVFFNAFSRWAGYEYWAPEVQGPSHWLVVFKDGPGSQFILYDKPGMRHLVHYGVVTELDRNRRFSWRAPFSEWKRAYIGTVLNIEPTSAGGARATETLFFDARGDHLPIVAGFMAVPGFDSNTMSAFMETRLRGLDRLIQTGKVKDQDLSYLFAQNQVLAADWRTRVSDGEWVRLLYADGEVDVPAPRDLVFNAFTRWARYADWTRTIHVGAQWHIIRKGGVGSRFLLWEKPADRHVMHYATLTEFERNKHFAWRAPFAEWDKVYIGTSGQFRSRSDGGTHLYHIIWVDMPREYLPVFTGFGTLPGLDLEYETWHIQEEVRGFNEILRNGAFSEQDQQYLFDEDRVIARDWPTETGSPYPYPDQVLTLRPDAVLTYEEAAVVVTEMLSDSIPGPQFFRKWRNQARTRLFNRSGGE